MRPIDADALLKILQKQQKYGSTADSRGRAKAIVEVIHAPTLDVVRVVRCKNCQHYFREQCVHPDYLYTEEYPWVDPDFYCAKGESSDDL